MMLFWEIMANFGVSGNFLYIWSQFGGFGIMYQDGRVPPSCVFITKGWMLT